MGRIKGKHVRAPLLAALAVLAVLGVSAASAPAGSGLNPVTVRHLSSGAAAKYYLLHPSAAPEQLQARLAKVREAVRLGPSRRSQPLGPSTFNADSIGLPQNEESITACSPETNLVLGGTNDYRGLIDPEGNFTGWHYSTNGGASLAKEGLLPPINGIPSGGDPVDVAAPGHCAFYAGDLNFGDPSDPTAGTNGVGVYRTTPATLNSPACRDTASPSDPDCWPTKRLVATNATGHFLDKEWIYAGFSGGTLYVWVVWSDFDMTDPNVPFTASIMASRCSADLSSCTAPQVISGSDQDIQFSDVTIGPDGRTYVTWSEIQGELTGDPQTFIHKLRIAPAGSTAFGPTRVVASEPNALPFGGVLQANDFRIATYPKNEVAMVGSTPRIFVIWDACSFRLLDTVCEYPLIKLAYSDNDGVSWTGPHGISGGGVNYFPTISVDRTTWSVSAAWYTNRYDAFQNAQDVDLKTFPASQPFGGPITRVTSPSNEPEADPILGGFFIGDYFEVYADSGKTLVHYNANYRQVPVLGGLPVNQQDNFLAVK